MSLSLFYIIFLFEKKTHAVRKFLKQFFCSVKKKILLTSLNQDLYGLNVFFNQLKFKKFFELFLI